MFTNSFENVLTEGSELQAKHLTNYWIAPERENVQLVVNLGCPKEINGFYIRNTHNAHKNNRATKKFSIFVSNSSEEFGELPILTGDFKSEKIKPPSKTVFFPLEKKVTTQFFMFQVDKYLRKAVGGGLHYISENPSTMIGETYSG